MLPGKEVTHNHPTLVMTITTHNYIMHYYPYNFGSVVVLQIQYTFCPCITGCENPPMILENGMSILYCMS